MPTNKTIDKLIDQAIDDALEKSDSEEEIKKRKPKPFRYLKDEEEIQAELKQEEPTTLSVMKDQTTAQIVDDNKAILGLGDLLTIENIIKKHQASRKFKEK
jgi:hypothetical protein